MLLSDKYGFAKTRKEMVVVKREPSRKEKNHSYREGTSCSFWKLQIAWYGQSAEWKKKTGEEN
jgi:hypothetical protein